MESPTERADKGKDKGHKRDCASSKKVSRIRYDDSDNSDDSDDSDDSDNDDDSDSDWNDEDFDVLGFTSGEETE